MENTIKLNKTELFTDDYLIERRSGLELEVNRPTPREKSVLIDKPWNRGIGAGAYTVVLRDGEKFRMFYRGVIGKLTDDNDETQCFCLAESDDGINWNEPELDVLEYGGQKTNVVLHGTYLAHNLCPFIDDNPACLPWEKYKALAGNHITGLIALSSPDGVHLSKMREDGVIKDGAFDSQNTAYFDRISGVYICYSRYFKEEAGEGVRAIQRCTSDDFINWSPQIKNTYNESASDDNLYTNAVTPIPGAEHILLSLPMRFMPKRKKLFFDGLDGDVADGVSDCIIMTSRGGMRWTMPDSPGFVRPDMDRRLWTQRNLIAARGVLETGDDLSFYINEHYSWDNQYIRRYSVPRHRLISLRAKRCGFFESKPLLLEGSALYLNYSTSAAGFIRLTLSAEGVEDAKTGDIYGNSLKEKVQWQGGENLSRFSGKAVRLKAELCDADLYAMTLE